MKNFQYLFEKFLINVCKFSGQPRLKCLFEFLYIMKEGEKYCIMIIFEEVDKCPVLEVLLQKKIIVIYYMPGFRQIVKE